MLGCQCSQEQTSFFCMKEELACKQGRRWRIRILKSEFTLLRFQIHRSAYFLLLLLFVVIN